MPSYLGSLLYASVLDTGSLAGLHVRNSSTKTCMNKALVNVCSKQQLQSIFFKNKTVLFRKLPLI